MRRLRASLSGHDSAERFRGLRVPVLLQTGTESPPELDVTDAAFHALVNGWTREAGVRGLERQIGKIARKSVRKVAGHEATHVVVDEPDLKEYVGRPRFRQDDASRAPIPGLATGLAVWTTLACIPTP